MTKGVTKSGFAFEIDEGITDDWDAIKLLNDITEGKLGAMFDFGQLLLGDEQLNALKEHVRGDGKRVSMQTMSAEMMEIFTSLANAKN